MFHEHESILKDQDTLNVRKKNLSDNKDEYIKNYFESYGFSCINQLPTSHNTFISSPKFSLKKGDCGNIFWVATGNRITIKDGCKTYGNAIDELWQGQWENMPEGIQNLTIEQAKEQSKPLFKMSPAVFKGVIYAAPAYILHEDENGWQLVWRKAGTAYIDRGSGSKSANSGLQILYNGPNSQAHAAWNEIKDKYNHVSGKQSQFVRACYDLTEGGRLSVGLIEKETDKIDYIFGIGVAQSIIEKIKLQSSIKSDNKKKLKNPSDKIEQNISPSKLKL